MIVCRREGCPRPGAVSEIIADPEFEHVVTFEDTGFTVRHPLRERLDDEMFRCTVHGYLAQLTAPPVPNGRYRMALNKVAQEYEYVHLGYVTADDH